MQLISQKETNKKGFTLIELLVVVSLVIITIGVSGDIILTLIRSFNKTTITNEIEQNSNFVLLKLEKELRNASSVTTPVQSNTLTFVRNISGVDTTINYTVQPDGRITRTEGGITLSLLNDDNITGVQIDTSGPAHFTDISSAGDGSVIGINLIFIQRDTSGIGAFEGSVTLENTVVVRGLY